MLPTRQALIAVLAATGVLLGACEGTLEDRVKQVQAKAVEICQYLPQANAVAAMLSASNPSIVGITPIANAICMAVVAWQNSEKTGSALTTECPRVNGVCVQGMFVPAPKGG